MPFKDPEDRRRYRRKWYSQNKESEKAHVRRRKKELGKWLKNYKKRLNCSKCKESHPATLEFHHKSSKEKERTISNMIGDGFSIKRILAEIKKCNVLCANCHKKLHYNKRISKL
ncbi:hypothetical protein CMI40_01705 [Candidatus Pacearchaeota archaeon]|jgi:hypothetical protein|nr:hypothetical protein [Candidatus Pacearchaeota archaeon]|tara:strand:+ start:911 stop:1252 length:342 start_codon:yes stop_codon:yes gene_type:complete